VNPYDRKEFKLLVEAVNNSFEKLKPFREKRKDAITEFCGSEYADNATGKSVYLNLLAMAVNIYVRQAVTRAPRAKITTRFQNLRPIAKNFELAVNDLVEDMNLGVMLRMAVTDALFSPLAAVKIGLKNTGKFKYGEEEIPVTEPFVNLISFDDYVRDMEARSAYSPAYEGNRYTMELDELHEVFPSSRKLGLSDSNLGARNDNRVESISHDTTMHGESIKKMIELQDLWLPKHRLMVTYVLDKPDFPISVVEYDTGEKGPYRTLWFTGVPDNAMPLAPLGLLKNLQKFISSCMRRLYSQAQKQKSVVGFNNRDSAGRFKSCADGDGIWWEGEKPVPLSSGGVNQSTFALMLQLKDVFSWAGGNLDSLGGLSPMAETATQDAQLTRIASGQIQDMQDATAEFAREIMEQLAWYEWTDPIRTRNLEKEIPGTSLKISTVWSPETRDGDFLDMNFNIIAESMREENPAAKLQRLDYALKNIFIPNLPVLMQQGYTLDFNKLADIYADYADLQELRQIITTADPNMMQNQTPTGNPSPVAGKPLQTKRTYERINRPGATRVGKESALIQTLMGGNVQPAEADAMTRNVG